MRNPFRRREPEQRMISWWSMGIDPSQFATTAGAVVNSETALGISTAWACVTLVANSVATLPVRTVVVEGGRTVEVPPPRWLAMPGGGLSGIDVRGQMMVSLLLRGNAYLLHPRDGGSVQGLTVLSPDEVAPQEDGSYVAAGMLLGPGELSHVRGLMPPTPRPVERLGLSPVGYAREVLGSAIATQQFSGSFFGNGAWPGSLVEVPGTLSETGQEALKTYINERHQGSRNAHKIGVLVEGAKLTRMTFSPEDSQFLQTREFQVADVARVFGVPPEMVGGKSTDSLTYTTLEGRSTHFTKFSLMPWVVRLEDAYTALWRSEGAPDGAKVELDVGGLQRGSVSERYAAYETGIRAGFLTADEVRQREGLPPLEEATP